MLDRIPNGDCLPPDEVTVVPPTEQKTLEWIAVLAAAGFDYRLSVENRQWVIHLPAGRAEAAFSELQAYETAEAQASAFLPAPAPLTFRFSHDLHTTLWAVVFLAGCYFLFGPAVRSSPAVTAGAADADKICAGEWWRVVTALTLHADSAHLAGNLFGIVLLGYLVSRIMGPGLGWGLVLASGAIGNAMEATFIPSHHISVGASTAVFGALGILVGYRGVQMALPRQFSGRTWKRAWFPFGAGLSLLAMWGGSPGTDILAHLIGFVVGLALAVPFSIREYEWMKGRVQTVLEMACIVVLVGAWGLAGMAK